MANDVHKPSSIAALKAASPRIAEAFLNMRNVVVAESSLDSKTQELILLAGFVVGRQEGGFRTHAGRALDAGATVADLKTAVLLTLGASAAVEAVGDALGWVNDIATARAVSGEGATV
jgi:alkylhydroperoxidase/carboxymuconolactone decarboxylase family protein YurZ